MSDAIALALAVARLIAQLDDELGAQVAALAAGRPAPPAPMLAAPATGRVLARALGDIELAAPARPYAAAWAWAAVEADPAVVAARAPAPSWIGLAALCRARDRAAIRAGAAGLAGLIATTIGAAAAVVTPVPAGDPAARQPGAAPVLDDAALAGALNALVAIHGGDPRGVRFATAAVGRTFVIAPGRTVIVAVPRAPTMHAWQIALHELGHALVGLRAGPRPRRAVDEGVAQWAARHLEVPAWIAGALGLAPDAAAALAERAARARARQVAQHRALAAFEAAVIADPAGDLAASWRALARGAVWTAAETWTAPPALLWHDPGAAQAYAAADALADAWTAAPRWWTARLAPGM